MKIAIITLGCKVNQSESASIEGFLREAGHNIVSHTANPDICIVNTCTVTAKSDYQSRQLIRKYARGGAKVIATGCYAQLKPAELSNIKGVSLVIGNSQKERLHEYFNNLPADTDIPFIFVEQPSQEGLTFRAYSSNKTRAFLKIQDGCNFSCSYCTIPPARGKSRSLNLNNTLIATDRLVRDGYKEIVLTGIHIGSYGIDLTPMGSLVELVDSLVKKYPAVRFRLSSIEPQEVKNEFLSLMKQKLLCRHLHIPLQSGSDRVLKVMNRGYSVSFLKKLIKDIASTSPDISIGTDVIVGFPGESDRDFEDTRRLLEELPFSYLHVFPYSKRPNTPAESMSNHVGEEIKRKRMEIILELAKIKKNNYATRHLGQKLNVIVENKVATNGFYKAISDNYLRILLNGNNMVPGQRLRVKVVSLINEELFGEPL